MSPVIVILVGFVAIIVLFGVIKALLRTALLAALVLAAWYLLQANSPQVQGYLATWLPLLKREWAANYPLLKREWAAYYPLLKDAGNQIISQLQQLPNAGQ